MQHTPKAGETLVVASIFLPSRKEKSIIAFAVDAKTAMGNGKVMIIYTETPLSIFPDSKKESPSNI
jgi:hypothetical protein